MRYATLSGISCFCVCVILPFILVVEIPPRRTIAYFVSETLKIAVKKSNPRLTRQTLSQVNYLEKLQIASPINGSPVNCTFST
jgi:hypothetical protein